MNTRLQVEHPVTECVTGLDLVEWQLRVAAGEPLPLRQDEIRWTGHAVEARLYAEDPYDGFAPQTGRIVHWRPARALRAGRADAGTQGGPAAGLASLRIDDGIVEGGVVSPVNDAMVAKVIVHGRDRADALRRLAAALEDAPLVGLRNNGRYLRDLVRHPEFVAGAMTTRRLDDFAADGEAINVAPAPDDEDWALAAALRAQAPETAPVSGPTAPSVASRRIALACAGETRRLAVAGPRVRVGERDVEVRLHPVDADGWRAVEIDGLRRRRLIVDDGERVHIVRDGAVHVFAEPSPYPQPDAAAAARVARAPTAGVVAHVAIEAGQRVAAGQPLVCVEAMKMEMWLNAAAAGVVAAVHVAARDTVAAGAVLVELELDPT